MKTKSILLLLLFISPFCFSQNKLDITYLQTINFNKAPLGAALFFHKGNNGFFVEYKFGGVRPPEERVKEWSKQEDAYDYSTYTWQVESGIADGSYGYASGNKRYRFGYADKYRILNFGFSKTFKQNSNVRMRFFVGVGWCRIVRQHVREVAIYSYDAVNLEFTGHEDMYISLSDYTEYYEIISEQNLHKLNITGGMLFEFESHISVGFGFDTQALGVNLMAGFRF